MLACQGTASRLDPFTFAIVRGHVATFQHKGRTQTGAAYNAIAHAYGESLTRLTSLCSVRSSTSEPTPPHSAVCSATRRVDVVSGANARLLHVSVYCATGTHQLQSASPRIDVADDLIFKVCTAQRASGCKSVRCCLGARACQSGENECMCNDV
jgi:hypothetical protein